MKGKGGIQLKKISYTMSALCLAGLLAACGAKEPTQENDATTGTTPDISNEETTTPSNNSHVGEAKNQDDMKSMMAELSFYEIELEVSYGHDQEYEAEIEHHHNGDIEAEVEDELNGVKLSDDVKAFNYIYPKAKNVTVTKDMDKQAVIDEVLRAFDLKNDYEKFEVEFEFEDGTKLSYEDKK